MHENNTTVYEEALFNVQCMTFIESHVLVFAGDIERALVEWNHARERRTRANTRGRL